MNEGIATQLGSDMVELILANVADGVFAVDSDFRITYFNAAAEEITGFSRGEALGRPCFEIFRTPLCHEDCPLRRSLHTGQKVTNFEIDILTSTRKKQTVSVSTAPLIDDGVFVGGVETFRDLSPIQELRRAIREQYTFEDVVAKSEPMRQLVAAVPNIAHSNAPVLLEGGAGTGKELIATAIHNAGRKDGPFVRVGCGSLAEPLLETELFGSETREGRIDAARGGTLLLDDVANIPLSLQAKLLRVLEEEGDDERARVIAATKHDLKRRVREGDFREDLYYRLNVVALRLPPLCERTGDIPHLIDHFIECLNLRMGRNIQGLSEAAMAILLRYPFPGNVRELENALEHAYIVAPGRRIDASDLPPHIHGGGNQPEKSRDDERDRLVACLERNHWSVPRAAHELGVHRTTLWRKLKRLGIERP